MRPVGVGVAVAVGWAARTSCNCESRLGLSSPLSVSAEFETWRKGKLQALLTSRQAHRRIRIIFLICGLYMRMQIVSTRRNCINFKILYLAI